MRYAHDARSERIAIEMFVLAHRNLRLLLVMQTDFKLEEAPRECQTLFSHADADARFGASIFWFREGMLPQVVLEEFFDTWQTKRDGTKRGIVEVTQ